jgi:RHS repeat-associated protein
MAHHLTDGLGFVRALTDATGAILGTVERTPYGGTVPTDFGYTGEYTDPTEMLYLRARHYDPATGVFPSLDPF